MAAAPARFSSSSSSSSPCFSSRSPTSAPIHATELLWPASASQDRRPLPRRALLEAAARGGEVVACGAEKPRPGDASAAAAAAAAAFSVGDPAPPRARNPIRRHTISVSLGMRVDDKSYCWSFCKKRSRLLLVDKDKALFTIVVSGRIKYCNKSLSSLINLLRIYQRSHKLNES
ncbi:hypothetical protein ACMD2_22877 [Ananas comosus]|uniref:Uncharacterized protein n=1 Tax=Ananas comosus TaxID=4615 RepID=A0A199V057_ANACO|nr:hypothetical protein ACMD2_22877 [Ananas comosus]